VDGRQGQGIVAEDSKGSRGSQRAVELMIMMTFMVMHSFVPPFREAKFCGVPSCVFDKLGCVAGEKKIAEHCYTRNLSLAFSAPL
jgi:hypothetical protein